MPAGKLIDAGLKRIEVHVVIGCQDSRDLSEAFLKAQKEMEAEMASNGVLIDFQRFAVAGTFITPELVAELKTMIFAKMAQYYEYVQNGVAVEFFFHINAHGDARLKQGADRHEHSVDNIEITKGAKTSCGMMHADTVAREMEELLLSEKPTIAGIKIRYRFGFTFSI